ncbi:MAG: hypothetical protein Kow0069_05560 [Promethearchaeota archaeon]
MNAGHGFLLDLEKISLVFVNQYPDWLRPLLDDPTWGYMRGFNLLAWASVVALMWGFALVFVHRARGADLLDSQRTLFRSMAFLFFSLSASIIAYAYAYHVEPAYELGKELGYTASVVSLLPVIYTVEKYMLPATRRLFTVFGCALAGVCVVFLFTPELSETLRTLTQVTTPVLAGTFFVLYLVVAAKSTGQVRARAVRTIVGMLLVIGAITLDSEAVMEAGAPLILAPLVYAAGIVMVGLAQRPV